MLPLLYAVAGALATARITRLLTADQLTLTLRRRVLAAVQEGGHLEYLLSCAWCASMWIAVPVAAAVVLLVPALRPTAPAGVATTALLALAYSHTAGRLARTEVEV